LYLYILVLLRFCAFNGFETVVTRAEVGASSRAPSRVSAPTPIADPFFFVFRPIHCCTATMSLNMLVGAAAGAVITWILLRKQNHRISDETAKSDGVVLSRRVRACKPLPIKEIAAQVAAKSAERKIINMSQGVPCLPIFEASKQAMCDLVESCSLPYSRE
jgi:hypothetical protein